MDAGGSRAGWRDCVRCNCFRFASIECVSFEWLSIECSIASTSWTRVSVVRVRRRDFGIGAESAFRPEESQLKMREGYGNRDHLPCRMATFRRIMVDGA